MPAPKAERWLVRMPRELRDDMGLQDSNNKRTTTTPLASRIVVVVRRTALDIYPIWASNVAAHDEESHIYPNWPLISRHLRPCQGTAWPRLDAKSETIFRCSASPASGQDAID